MSEAKPQRVELSKFLADNAGGLGWRIIDLLRFINGGSSCTFDAIIVKFGHPQNAWRIHAINPADYAIRPKDPATIEGGPEIKVSTDDARLADPRLQLRPGGDGEIYDPPRVCQLLELDQSWVIAERFEIEPLTKSLPT